MRGRELLDHALLNTKHHFVGAHLTVHTVRRAGNIMQMVDHVIVIAFTQHRVVSRPVDRKVCAGLQDGIVLAKHEGTAKWFVTCGILHFIRLGMTGV